MMERKDVISHCLTYKSVYEDYPFRDKNWCVIRHRENRKAHWNSIILDGTIPEKEIRRMIGESYDLTKKERKG